MSVASAATELTRLCPHQADSLGQAKSLSIYLTWHMPEGWEAVTVAAVKNATW
jgi:hypothetical protein